MNPRTFNVRVSGELRTVGEGSSFGELLPRDLDQLPVVAALVDGKAYSLTTLVTANCSVEPLTPHSWEGRRIQRRSLALLVLEAAVSVAPGARIKMGPSVGFGQRILVSNGKQFDLAGFGVRLEARLRELVGENPSLSEETWAPEEAREYFAARGLGDAEQLLRTWRDPVVPLVSYGTVRAIETGPMLPNPRGVGEFYVLCDEDFLLLVYGRRPPTLPKPSRSMPAIALSDVGEAHQRSVSGSTQSFLISQARTSGGASHDVGFEEQTWLRAIGGTSVGSFNHACVGGSVANLIRVCEGFQEKRIMLIADAIDARRKDIDIVCIAGPSSSGKSTFIKRLCVQLEVNGITPLALGLDDYYTDRDKTPLDTDGDYDFEALEAIQLELLHDHVARLLRAEAVVTPRYDFKAGRSRADEGHRIQLGADDVLLIEGIHGLNPSLLGAVPATRVFRIFVCPLMQLAFDHASRVHASDVRLIRRIVRDRHARGNDAAQTIARWPKVRAGERRHIYPYQSHADAVFDSSLVYELSVLRVYAERYLLEVPRNSPSYPTAFRLIHMLDRFVSIYPDHVPPTSILREFVGGSGFEY